jgi:hypothetical protein
MTYFFRNTEKSLHTAVKDANSQISLSHGFIAYRGCFVTPQYALSAEHVHDEIQVYNGEIADVGQWTIEQHLNYAWRGQTTPDFPGAFTSNHSLQGTPEFAYGITDWWEAGFYLPFAISSSGQALSDGVKVRSLFVFPVAAKRNFFYGVNFELSYERPSFAQDPWGWKSVYRWGSQHKLGVCH